MRTAQGYVYAYVGILAVLLILLALPGSAGQDGGSRSIGRFSGNLFRLFFGILIPITFFIASALFGPHWRDPKLSPYSCLNLSKYILWPFVLWACVSFYLVVVVRVVQIKAWMVLGLFSGLLVAIVSNIIFLYLFFSAPNSLNEKFLLSSLLLPLVYVPYWYASVAYRCSKNINVERHSYLLAVLAQAGFWFWAAKKSEQTYYSLSGKPCYVVTASAYGYPWLVHPKLIVDEKGVSSFETQQLIRFRRFEKALMESCPRTHGQVRGVYNRVGPYLAGRIRGPLLASLAYLALKPIEWSIQRFWGTQQDLQ